MNRKLVGGLAALVVGVVAIWFFFLRDRGDAPAATPAAARSSEVGKPAAAKPKAEGDAPRGGAVRWQLDVEPEGPLQLEGQVLGPDGTSIAGAEVRVDSVPPRTTKSEDDGTFQFDRLVGRSYTLVASSGELVGSTIYKLTDKSDPAVVRLAEGAKLTVTVTDEAKAPIANATVRARESGRSAKTDAKGEATLSPLQPGWVGAQAVADGYAPGSAFTTIGSGGASGRLAITLRKGFAVSGRVVDEAGKPVAKARVTFANAEWGFGADDGDPSGRDDTVTDGKGQFQLPAVAAGDHGLVAVDGEHAPGTARVTVSTAPVTGVEIVMKEGGRIAGRVVDSSKQPVPFATVRVGGADQQMFTIAARQSTTDKTGAFEVRGLVRTQLAVVAESDVAASTLTKVDLSEQASREGLELVLDQTGTIAGTVVDEQGAPVAETSVYATPDFSSGAAPDALMFTGMSTSTTDGAGAFTIRGLPAGSWRLRASRGMTQARWMPGGTQAKTGDQHVKLTLATPGSIKGRLVVAGSNEAPAFAMVQIGWLPPTPAREGVFELREVEPGEHLVTVRGAAFTNHEQRVKVESGKATDVGTITLQRGRRVIGKVLDATGAPVPDAKVRLGDWLVTLEGDQGAYENLEAQQGIRSTRSRADGSFELVGVPQKASTAMASHATLGSSPTVAIPEGTDDPPPITITLAGFGSITGVVTSKGKPVSAVTITLTSKAGGRQMSFAQTDATGTYKLTKVSEGTYTVQAMRGDAIGTSFSSETASAQVVAGKQSTVNIDIPVGSVSLLVKLEPLPGAKFDLVQTFLYSGSVAYGNGKQIMESFAAGGAKGMKIWMGKDAPMPEFTELVPGSYSICSIPLTGNMEDPGFQRKLQEHIDKLKVYCKAVKVGESPTKQTVVHQLPSMDPLPDSK